MIVLIDRLSGLKVLDLTHVLAGPTCGMMLAEQDADVMRINGPQIPFIPSICHGYRTWKDECSA